MGCLRGEDPGGQGQDNVRSSSGTLVYLVIDPSTIDNITGAEFDPLLGGRMVTGNSSSECGHLVQEVHASRVLCS